MHSLSREDNSPDEGRNMKMQRKGLPLEFAFPDISKSFASRNRSLDEVKKDCNVALDANVLLEAYRLTSSSLEELRKIYAALAEPGRLFVPAQAAREFKKNRPKYLADAAKALKDERGRLGGKRARIRFLESDPNYIELMELEADFHEQRKRILEKLDRISETLRSWIDGDPIMSMYEEVIGSAVYEQKLTDAELEECLKDLAYRQTYGIPPGFKDSAKADQGVGDLLIWRSLLQIAGQKKDLIFVTNEKKPDWWALNHGEPFLPRPELIDEYQRASGGMSLHIMSFVEFLTIFSAPQDVIDETVNVEREEATLDRIGDADLEEIIRLEVEVNDLSSEIESMMAYMSTLPDDWNEGNMSLPWNRTRQMLRSRIYNTQNKLKENRSRLMQLRAKRG